MAKKKKQINLEEIKARWQTILGPDGKGTGAICPLCGSGSGKKGTGLSPIAPGSTELHCFACGESGDVLHFIGKKYGWENDARDFPKTIEYCSEAAGLTQHDFFNETHSLSRSARSKEPERAEYRDLTEEEAAWIESDNTDEYPGMDEKASEQSDPADDLSWLETDTKVSAFEAKYSEAEANLMQTDYWKRRGLSEATCRHFHVGYLPLWVHPKNPNGKASPRLIIPTGVESYLARDVRNPMILNNFEREYTKIKVGPTQIFNAEALDCDIVIVVEGEIDAMSVYEAGYANVIGLGSISMIKKFLAQLDKTANLTDTPIYPKAMIVALDNEEAKPVQKAKRELLAALKERRINYVDGSKLSEPKKDANELLVTDRDALKENIKELMAKARSMPIQAPLSRAEYEDMKVMKMPAKAKSVQKKDDATLVLTGTRTTKEVLPDCPVEFLIPDGYVLTEDGILAHDTVAARSPVVPVAMIINHKTRQQKFELMVRDVRGRWLPIIAEASTIFNKTNIVELTNLGVRTYAGSAAKSLVKYLFDMIGLNEPHMTVKEEYDQTGWSSDFKEFRLPNMGEYYMPTMVNIYEEAGDENEWLARCNKLRQNSAARLTIACGFAAPLLRVLGQRSFIYYLYGTSKAGKSACQKYAISAFGNPDKMMGTFNTTQNGLESMATRSNDLPLLIDESTVASRLFDFDKLNYMLAGEQTRVRMDRTLQQRPQKHWRLTAMMNGEGQMFDDASREGAMNRALEIALEPDEKFFESEVEANQTHEFLRGNHGHVGRRFLTELLKDQSFDIPKRNYKDLFDGVKSKVYPRYTLEQISQLSILGTADMLYEMWFNGKSEDDAFVDTIKRMIIPALKRLPTADQMSEDGRAWAYLIEYLQARRAHLYGDHHKDPGSDKIILPYPSPMMGEMIREERPTADMTGTSLQLTEVLVLPTVVKGILADKGFNPTKMIRAFRRRGWIETDSDGGYPKREWSGSARGSRQRMFVIPADKYTPAP